MSFENAPSTNQNPEPNFEVMNAALANEWPMILENIDGYEAARHYSIEGKKNPLFSDSLGVSVDNLGVDEDYIADNKRRNSTFSEVLARLKNQGITPENHKIPAAIKKLVALMKEKHSAQEDYWEEDRKAQPIRMIEGGNFEKARELYTIVTALRLQEKEAMEQLKDTVEKYNASVTGAF